MPNNDQLDAIASGIMLLQKNNEKGVFHLADKLDEINENIKLNNYIQLLNSGILTPEQSIIVRAVIGKALASLEQEDSLTQTFK